MGIKLIKTANEAAYTAIKNPEQSAFIIDCGTPEKAKELNDAFGEVAFAENGWEPNKAVIGGELIQSWNVGQYFTACVDPCDKAVKWCEEWLRNSDGTATNEDRRGKDRYGHPVRRFTSKDLQDIGDGDTAGDEAPASNGPKKFGLAYLDTIGMDAFSNSHDSHKRDLFLHDLADMPVSKDSIEKLLKKYPLRKYSNVPVLVRDFFPDNGIAYLGIMGPDGVPYKTLCLRWGPALKK